MTQHFHDEKLPPIDLQAASRVTAGPKRGLPPMPARGTVYRQRLTTAGFIGAVIWLIGPLILGWLWSETVNAQSLFQRPSAFWLVIVAMITALSPILLLIGREYYED